MNILSLLIVSFLYVYAFLLFYTTFLSKKKGRKGAFINNLANTIVFVTSITINLILIHWINPLQPQFLAFPFDILFLGFIILYIPLFIILVIKEMRMIKGGKRPFEEYKTLKLDLPLKYDIYRKITHFIVIGIIFSYFTLGFLIQNFFIYLLDLLPNFVIIMFDTGDNIMNFTQNLVVFLVGISLIGLLTADFSRILIPKYFPLKGINQILKEKELHMRLGPHISMSIGCFSIILLFGLIQPIGPIVICTSMIMGVFGDTASNLIGRTKGKRKIRNTNKTYEGLLAGIIVALLSGFIVLYILQDFYKPKNFGSFFIPIIGALLIGLIDYLDLEIDDNLSNNFILSTLLFFTSILFF
ncbi:hypothetical protein LCGC14_0492720 [marine sediment metagenome]|uniref:Phosphatidate cytidylyltransferase n=1 Tax=marine sediment metagenome TaxID=412755 RepID=A0A0F9SBB4_9ZZZZ|nr:MAG: Cytidylyltransferase family protein [Candidatus Lokiarchaeum sp. GC14_75]